MIDPNAPHEDDELLTSYLDGELSESERRALQNRLMDDADLRDRLSDLQKAWDLLDDLPDTPVNQEFTKSTLELAAVGTETGWVHQKGEMLTPRKWWKGPRVIALALCASLALGIAAGATVRMQGKREELKRLSIIAQLPGLSAVESVETLKSIAQIPELQLVIDHPEIFESRSLPTAPSSLNEREAWVERLSSVQKFLLYSHHRESQKLPPAQWDNLAQLWSKIGSEPNGEQLQQALSVVTALYDSGSEFALLKAPSEVPLADRIRKDFYRKLAEWYFYDLEKQNESDNRIIRGDWRYELGTSNPEVTQMLLRSSSSQQRKAAWGVLINEVGYERLFSTDTSGGKRPLSDLARKILQNLDHADRVSILAECIDDSIPFRAVAQSYKGLDPEEREVRDLGTYSDLRRWTRPFRGPSRPPRSDRPPPEGETPKP